MKLAKRTKFRKHQKGRCNGIASNNFKNSICRYKIISLSSIRLRASTIEAVRRVITKKLKRTGQVCVPLQCSLSITEKPLEVRMGKGKGSVSYWVCRIKKGQTLYEIDGFGGTNYFSKVEAACQQAGNKLPMKTVFCYSFP